MKTIVFNPQNDESHKDHFLMVHQGFLLGQPQEGLKGLSARKTAIKILDKLESISHVRKDNEGNTLRYQTGDEVRDLNEDGGKLELEDNEHEMLKSHFENFLPNFRTGASRQVVAAAELMEM